MAEAPEKHRSYLPMVLIESWALRNGRGGVPLSEYLSEGVWNLVGETERLGGICVSEQEMKETWEFIDFPISG